MHPGMMMPGDITNGNDRAMPSQNQLTILDYLKI
jgi:hypothetical protein